MRKLQKRNGITPENPVKLQVTKERSYPVNKNTTKQNESQALLFSFNERVSADFKGGKISSDGGLILLREFDKRISFVRGINNQVRDPRHPLFILH